MANLIKVRVSKVSKQASKNGNFIHTLKTEGKTIEVLGQTKTANGLTYFMALKTPTAEQTVHEIDLDLLKVTESDYVVPVVGSTTGETQTLKLKWLSVL